MSTRRSKAKGRAGSKAKRVATLAHAGAKRPNIPTAETQSYMREEEQAPTTRLYPRNPDLDPQLVWRGKDEQDRADLAVDTVPIYIQEKVHPKAIVDDLLRVQQAAGPQPDLFADFNGLHDPEAKLEFYSHALNWSNRMILGDSLLVMSSLAEKEKLKGRVQMIYMDPPYGIKFGSNWQASTKQRDVKDGKTEDMSREPEVIRAFRDTWELGVHSYLSYLRDRFVVARELLTDSGSVFVQIGDENVHLVRSLLDEVFGPRNFIGQIDFKTTAGLTSDFLAASKDYVLWYTREDKLTKFRRLFSEKIRGQAGATQFGLKENRTSFAVEVANADLTDAETQEWRVFGHDNLTSTGFATTTNYELNLHGRKFQLPAKNIRWKTPPDGMQRLLASNRLMVVGNTPRYKRYLDDFPVFPIVDVWTDTGISGFSDKKAYVVQTNTKVVERCVLMTTDPGDLVLDPTCGSGTTAYVAEQWGRRWITIDTSRVALALARARLMGARFPYYTLADSADGLRKEAEITGKPQPDRQTTGDIRRGFVYERVPHITLKSIANNAEIDVIYERWQRTLKPLCAEINQLLGAKWEEWEVPRTLETPASKTGREQDKAKSLLEKWWRARRERQQEIDALISRNAETEYLYDRPYEDKGVVRVTGPFTVESLSPHRVLPADEQAEELLLDAADEAARAEGQEPPPRPPRRKKIERGEDDFVRVVLENLKSAGVQNTKKKERLVFTELKPWAGGKWIHAEGRYEEAGKDRRAAICIGPEYGTVSYQLVREAAREAKDLFDVLVVCGFAFEPHVGEDTMSLGRLVVLKARMNQELHMAEHLKKTGAGNLFVVFGEPDIAIEKTKDGSYTAEIRGLDIFDPTTGAVRSSSPDDIACWFIDTDYDEESFFVRHAYFLGGRDPYERLKRTLKAEIDEAAWATLYSAKSRPFAKPKSGKIAVKVINHYGDEVLKVYSIA